MDILQNTFGSDRSSALKVAVVLSFSGLVLFAWLLYGVLHLVAPRPRPPLPSEKKYRTVEPDGNISGYEDLPCWHERYVTEMKGWDRSGRKVKRPQIGRAEVHISVVVPAFNEEERLAIMLNEAVIYLEDEYGSSGDAKQSVNGSTKQRRGQNGHSNGHAEPGHSEPTGWEVLVVSDGSTDRTVDIALSFAKTLKGKSSSSIRVIQLHENRGKGGAVTHGMRHVRGEYVVFADADGASKFTDLGKLLEELRCIEDDKGRAVAVGSRAHLVGSEAVVQRSFLRNLLMHSFHLLLRLLTPPATAAIRDTQCGFKLFTRTSLPHIIPHMHCEGWIFDVEMLMLAEFAKIPVVEVPVGWREVKGSKLNVLWDSLGMAWGLAILRAAWGSGIYRSPDSEVPHSLPPKQRSPSG